MSAMWKGGTVPSRLSELENEVNFIEARTKWLKIQPRNADGMLLRLDDRLEAGMLGRRIEELEQEILCL
jgi:hypothetical protein